MMDYQVKTLYKVSNTIITVIVYPPKLALENISYVNFFNLAQIKKNDNFGQVALLFDINFK